MTLYSLTGTCQFGDKVTWCSSYVRGPDRCLKSEVAENCCHTCAQYVTTTTPPTTSGEILPCFVTREQLR